MAKLILRYRHGIEPLRRFIVDDCLSRVVDNNDIDENVVQQVQDMMTFENARSVFGEGLLHVAQQHLVCSTQCHNYAINLLPARP